MNVTLPEPARRKPVLKLIVEYLPVAAALLTVAATLLGGTAGAALAWSKVNSSISDVSRELKTVKTEQAAIAARVDRSEIEAIKRQLAQCWTVDRQERWIVFSNLNLFPTYRLASVAEAEYLPLRPTRGAETSRD